MTERAAISEALRHGAVVVDAPATATLEVTGPERTSWLNALVTCELAQLVAPSGAYGFAVAKNGKILAEVRIVLTVDRILIGVAEGDAEALRRHLDQHLVMEDAEIGVAAERSAWLLAHGPLAPDVVAAARSAGAHAASMDMTGFGGAAIVALESNLANVRGAIATAAAPAVFAAADEWEPVRIEIGIGRLGIDFGHDNYPQETSLEPFTVSFNKGCYLGQETVFMLHARGHVKKKLVPLVVDGEGDVAIGADVALADGTSVGAITSRVPTSGGDAIDALAYVKYKHASVGTELVVAGRRARVRDRAAPSAGS